MLLNVNNIYNMDNKQGWKARLQLDFVHNGKKTLLAKREQYGPLTVQRPFYPEAGLCHVYLLHPPGGVVAGDQLSINVNLEANAEALITTPGAGKFYRSTGKQASQKISLKLKDNASLEWLPQETIVYEGARLISDLRVDLAENSRFIGWEILALGRPAAGEGFNQGEVFFNWQVYREGVPLFLEKMRLDSETISACWGLNTHLSCGTLLISCASDSNLNTIRDLIGDTPNQGVTLINDLLICRASADKTGPVRTFFENVRAAVRMDVVQREAYRPRIWST